MKTFLYATVALGILGGAAQAEPLRLTDAQLDSVTAGLLDNMSVLSNLSVANNLSAGADLGVNIATLSQLGLSNNTASAFAVGALSDNVTADVVSGTISSNIAGVGQQ